MGYNYDNTPNIVRQDVYRATLDKALDDWLIGRPLYEDVSGMFPDGDTFKTTKTGQRATSDYEDDTAIAFDNMQTSRVELNLTNYEQDGFYITDKLKRDGWQAEAFFAENVDQSALAFERSMEKSCLSTANSQTLGSGNIINGARHRFKGSGTSNVLTIQDIQYISYAFDKAFVPVENRLLIVPPEMTFELDKLVNMTEVTNGSTFNFNVDGLVQTGFGNRLNVRRTIGDINIMVSHNLPDITAETLTTFDGNNSGAFTGKACIAMSLANANSMPFQGVIRQRPTPEFFRNTHYKRDEWSCTAEWGFGLKKAESLIVVGTPATITA